MSAPDFPPLRKTDDAALAAEFARRLAIYAAQASDEKPVCGFVQLIDGQAFVDVAAPDFNRVHWIALADACIEHAMTRMAEMSDPPLDLLASCNAARAALGFVDEVAQ